MIAFAHDYETTGVKPGSCGVVQAALCFVKVYNDGAYEILSKDVQMLNPGEPIPEDASKIHGIYDRHVVAAPDWEMYLSEQFDLVNDTALDAVIGYNSKRYDDIIARRAGMKDFPSLDVYTLASRLKSSGKLKKGKLGEVYEEVTGKVAENAHDAFADIVMTLDLIQPLMDMAEIEDVWKLQEWVNTPYASRQMRMPFGKHKGVKVCNLPKDYVRWALKNLSLGDDLRMSLELVK